MKNQILLFGAICALSACSWVDETGAQSNVKPAADAADGMLSESDTYTVKITDERQVQAEFIALSAGPTIALDCDAPLSSAESLDEACAAFVSTEDCELKFSPDEGVSNSFTTAFPALQQSIALKYNVKIEDHNGAQTLKEVLLCVQSNNAAPKAAEHAYQVEYRKTLETSDAIFDEACSLVSGTGVLRGSQDDFDFATLENSALPPCLNARIVTEPLHAIQFSLNTLGGFVYQPSSSLAPGADDSFSYVVNDGERDSIPKTVTIAVIGENSGPVILEAPELATDENGSERIAVSSLASDPEGEPLSIFQVGAPLHGTTIQNSAGDHIIYTPEEDFHGEDSFSFTVQDVAGATATGRLSITVLQINEAPEITARLSYVFDFDNGDPSTRFIELLLTDRETQPELLRLNSSSSRTDVATVRDPAAIDSDGVAMITLEPQQNGSTEITFNATDRGQDVSPASRADQTTSRTATVTILGINRAPVATDITRDVQQGGTLGIDLKSISSDPDGNALSFALNGSRAGVSLSGSTLSFSTAATQSPGRFTVSYRVSDGRYSDTGAVTVEVTKKPNRPPTVRDASANVAAGESASVDLAMLSNDADGDRLRYELVAPPTNARLNGTTLTVTTEASDSSGIVSVVYHVSDGEDSDTGVFRVTISATPNQPPTIRDSSATVRAGETASVDLATLSNDADGDTLSYSIVGTPANARLNGTTLNVTTDAGDSSGTVSVHYRVSDGEESDTGTFSVSISATPNRAPTIRDSSATVQAGETASVDLSTLSNDADGDTLSYSIVGTPANARLNGTTLNVTTDTGDSSGTVSVDYRVSDGEDSDIGTFSVTISAIPNHPPTIRDSSGSITAGATASVDLATLSSDADGDTLSYELLSPPTNARLTGTTLNVTTDTGDSSGTVSVDYRVSDGEDSDTGTFSVTVSAIPNEPPTTRDVSRSIQAGEFTSLDLADISDDPDGNNSDLNFSISSAWSNVSLTNGVIRFDTVASDSTQTASVVYTVSDDEASVSGTLTVSITAANRPPVAGAGSFEVLQGSTETFDLSSISSDPDAGDSLSYSLITPPTQASVSGSVVTYAAAVGDPVGAVTLSYRVSDDDDSSMASVIVTVTEAVGG